MYHFWPKLHRNLYGHKIASNLIFIHTLNLLINMMCVLLKNFLVQFILYCSMILFQQQTLRTYILYKPCIQRPTEDVPKTKAILEKVMFWTMLKIKTLLIYKSVDLLQLSYSLLNIIYGYKMWREKRSP